jgi:hypothetical protein
MANTNYFEFEVTLLEVEPRLWRRFLLRHTFSFEELHGAIQMACGWQFSHLYEFIDDDGQCIARASPADDEPNVPSADKVALKTYFTTAGRQCLYIYDFGDYWQHQVKFLEKVSLPDRFVQRLTGGAGMFPPEDCGGVPGYEDCVKACRLKPAEIKKLDPSERKEILSTMEWLDEWRPDGFDLKKMKAGFER